MTVNAYDLDNYGEDTNIYVSMDNLAQSMEEMIDENSIITCYRVVGGDNVEVAEINPNGTNKIYNFEYYLPEMEESIQNKVIAYNEKYQSLKLTYQSITDRMRQQLDVIQELYTRNPESAESTDWSLYGLYMLQDKRDSYKNVDEVYCAQGMNKPDSFNYNLYAKNKELLDSVQVELDKRQTEVESAEATYNSIKAEMTSLQEQLDMDKWFTKDEWKTLDTYVVEETYSNDNYSIADNTTDVELFDIEKQLYDVAWKDLSKKCRPQYQYKSTLSNVLTIPQFKGFLKYFQLGNFIRMATDYDTVIKLRLISFTVDYNDTSKIDVTFSDAIRVHGVCNDVASIISQANSAAMSFQFNKDQYDKSVNQSNFVEEMRKYGLDVANIPVKNQHQSWDETGMWFRQWNEQKNDFDPEQIKIINNQIVFSDDGFQSAKMAIGKIPIDKNGNTVYAVNAEAILGKLFLGEYLTLQNNSGTYKFNDDGFIASSGKNSVKIQPNNASELFSIYKDNQKQVYINSDGDVEFAGSLKSASGTFSGLISGGEININNTFTVDSNGNMYASSGVFSGTLKGADGEFSGTLRGNDIIGATITGANGEFTEGFSVNLKNNDITKMMKFDGNSFEVNIQSAMMTTRDNSIVIDPYATRENNITLTANNGFGHVNIIADEIRVNDIGSGYRVVATTDLLKTSEISATYGGSNNNIIKFSNASSTNYCAATPHWVKAYVSNKIPDTSKFITGFSGDSTSGVYNSIRTSGNRIVGSKISYDDLKKKLSDKRLKKDISSIAESAIEDFYMNLIPTRHKYKNGVGVGEDGKYQFGVIAQWTEKDMIDHDINPDLYSIVRKSKPFADTAEAQYTGGDDVYRVDYDQFHALHIYMIQKQQAKIKGLELEVDSLKQKLGMVMKYLEIED